MSSKAIIINIRKEWGGKENADMFLAIIQLNGKAITVAKVWFQDRQQQSGLQYLAASLDTPSYRNKGKGAIFLEPYQIVDQAHKLVQNIPVCNRLLQGQ